MYIRKIMLNNENNIKLLDELKELVDRLVIDFNNLTNRVEKNEEDIINLNNELYLSKYAAKDSDAIRLYPIKEDIRPNYFRDIDRIIYSLSYTRYIDKTQVFSRKDSDHITKRIIHVQLVSKVARTIGRALSLNEDLIEAQALGHDIGHVPFGHLGESYLNELSLKHNEGYFMHNVESVRELMILEDNGKGKNLTIQTLDGILCHNGELLEKEYKPVNKTKEDFLHDYEMCYKDKEYAKKLRPMTLEGCVVRISDIIAYLGRDIEDAIRLGVFKKEEIPKSIQKILGNNNHDIVGTIVNDIINNSIGKDSINMSPEIYEAIKDLKEFNYIHIYDKANTKEEKEKIKFMFNTLFDKYLNDLNTNNTSSSIYKVFLKGMTTNYLENTTNERKIIDYIAGMTDDYMLKEFNNL